MASESLPKFMFLHQDSQEMSDKRIRTYQTYREEGDRAERVYVKRVNNTIPTLHPPNSQGIFNLEYSNKYGLLFQAIEDQVLVVDKLQLEQDLLAGKQNPENYKSIQFAGQVFLCPSEDILAVCSESLLQLVSMEKVPAITCPPIAKSDEHTRLLWTSDSQILLWGFLGKATLITINRKTLEKMNEVVLKDVEECTGASIVGTHLLICQKREILVYQLGKIKLLKKVDMNFQYQGWMYYEYSYIIDIFRVNVHTSPTQLNTRLNLPLNKEDVLGFVMVFYDDQDFENNERCLIFYRGNLLEGGRDMRGNENFYVAQNRNDLYFQEDKMIPFAVKVAYVGCLICIMLERSSTVYIVDPFEKFEVINIYSPHGKLDFKAQGVFFRGMGILRTMLPFEKKVPEDVKTGILPKIVKDFSGEFMSLYFVDQETNLTVPFPASVIALTQSNIYRRYAVTSLGGIEKDQDQEILADLQQIRRSPYLLHEDRAVAKPEAKEQGNLFTSLFGANKSDLKPSPSFWGGPKTDSPVNPIPNLFLALKANSTKTDPTKTDSPVNPIPSLFGAPKAEPPKTDTVMKPSLFGAPKTDSDNKQTTNPFAKLLNKTTAGMFGAPKDESKAAQSGQNLSKPPLSAQNESNPAAKKESETPGLNAMNDSAAKVTTIFKNQVPNNLFSMASKTGHQAFSSATSQQGKSDFSSMFAAFNTSKTDQPSPGQPLNKVSNQPTKALNQPTDDATLKAEPKKTSKQLPPTNTINQPQRQDFVLEKTAKQSQSALSAISSQQTSNTPTPKATPSKNPTQKVQQATNTSVPPGKESKVQRKLQEKVANSLKGQPQKKVQQVAKEPQSQNLQEVFPQQDQFELTQRLQLDLNYIKEELSKIKSSRLFSKGVAFHEIRQFCEQELTAIKQPESLCLGGTLTELLQKAQNARKNYLHYEQILESSLKENISQSSVQKQLTFLQNKLTKGLYYRSIITPKQLKKSAISPFEREKRNLEILSQDIECKISNLREGIQQVSNKILKEEVKVETLMRSRPTAIGNDSNKKTRKFDFNDFNAQFELEAAAKKVRRESRKPRSNPYIIIKKVNKEQRSLILVKIDQFKERSRYTLPSFEVAERREPPVQKKQQKPPQAQSAPAKTKLTTSPSFTQINQSFGQSIAPKTTQKVEVPQVNTRELELPQNQTISETLEMSESEDNIPLPVANRQISKIQIPQAQQKINPGASFFSAATTNKAVKADKTDKPDKVDKAEKAEKTEKAEEKQKSQPQDNKGIKKAEETNFLFGAKSQGTKNTLFQGSAANKNKKPAQTEPAEKKVLQQKNKANQTDKAQQAEGKKKEEPPKTPTGLNVQKGQQKGALLGAGVKSLFNSTETATSSFFGVNKQPEPAQDKQDKQKTDDKKKTEAEKSGQPGSIQNNKTPAESSAEVQKKDQPIAATAPVSAPGPKMFQNKTENILGELALSDTTQTQNQPTNPPQAPTNTAPKPEDKPALTNPNAKLFNNTSTSVGMSPYPQQPPNETQSALLASQMTRPTFGGPNKFMLPPQALPPPKPAFDPKLMSFGGAVQKPAATGQHTNLFLQAMNQNKLKNQQNQNTDPNNPQFNQSSMFANPNQSISNPISNPNQGIPNPNQGISNSNQAQGNTMFNNSNAGNTMFNANQNQGNSMFNKTDNPQNNTFFNPNAPNTNPMQGNNMQSTNPMQGNNSMQGNNMQGINPMQNMQNMQGSSSGMFGQGNNQMFGQGGNQMVGQGNNQLFGQGSNQTFGQQSSNNEVNFLKSFVPKTTMSIPAGINPALLQPRK